MDTAPSRGTVRGESGPAVEGSRRTLTVRELPQCQPTSFRPPTGRRPSRPSEKTERSPTRCDTRPPDAGAERPLQVPTAATRGHLCKGWTTPASRLAVHG